MTLRNLITLIICILNVLITNGQFANIGNGQVILGIDTCAQLNSPYTEVLGLPAEDPLDIGYIGLRNGAGDHASTEPGCLCEGWGFSTGTVTGFANNYYGGATGLSCSDFEGSDGGTSAVVTVQDSAGSTFEVIHDYHPSPDSQWTMECIVTIKNIGSDDWPNTFYRRVMDWDIFPTPMDEYISIIGWGATALIGSHDDGLCTGDPLVSCVAYANSGTVNVDFHDNGPADHGALFDFDLGPLQSGEELQFKIFYGVAPGESVALTALNDIGAEVASLGQQRDDPVNGLPYTFFFAFSGVGGEVISACDKYKYIDDGTFRTWSQAKVYCETEFDTELATITTDEELQCALDLIAETDGSSPWIGLNSLDSGDAGDLIYSLDGTPCPVPHNGIWGQCVISDWWRYTNNGAHDGRPRCPHNKQDGSQCVRLLPDPIGLLDNDVKCDNGYTIGAVLCNAPSINLS